MSFVTDRMVFLPCPKTGTLWVRNALDALGIKWWANGPHHGINPESDGRFHWTLHRAPSEWLRSYYDGIGLGHPVGCPEVDALMWLGAGEIPHTGGHKPRAQSSGVSFADFVSEYLDTCPDQVDVIFAAYAEHATFIGETSSLVWSLGQVLIAAGHDHDAEELQRMDRPVNVSKTRSVWRPDLLERFNARAVTAEALRCHVLRPLREGDASGVRE